MMTIITGLGLWGMGLLNLSGLDHYAARESGYLVRRTVTHFQISVALTIVFAIVLLIRRLRSRSK